jgi:D-alanyl-lipoteichoic acid acyltransferase DltB (MBOAT superfamily)
MQFNSLQYGVFFVAVLAVHWCLPRAWGRPFLVLASYYFYASAIPQYILLILGLTIFNYLVGLWIDRAGGRLRLVALWVAVAGNLSTLGYFKYSGLIAESVLQVLRPLPLLGPLDRDLLVVRVILPLGISFFTFEFIHYAVEVYKGMRPTRNPVDFALFAAFFPTQIAGPIKRFPDFKKQLEHPLQLREVDFDYGIWLILRGLVKKVLVADVLAPIVATSFAMPAGLGPVTAWFAVFAFATQIYCDFSGYTDIGRGSATLLGYSVPENFNRPYQSASPGEFWHRWHMSLSTWLRDYLYFPLGGSRVPGWRIYINLMITMALGGLWHGASWHFMIWGIYQGALLCADRLWSATIGGTAAYRHAMRAPLLDFLRRPVTLLWVSVGWVFFRADSVGAAFQMFRSLISFSRPLLQGHTVGLRSAPVTLMVVVAIVVFGGWMWSMLQTAVVGWWNRMVAGANLAWLSTINVVMVRPALYLGAIGLLMVWPAHAATQFIYFRF